MQRVYRRRSEGLFLPVHGLAVAPRCPSRSSRLNGIVRIALQRPLTFIVMAVLILIFGVIAAVSTPADIFPDIKVPAIAVAWQYTGLSADDMAGRVMYPFERTVSTLVSDLEHMESNSIAGIGVERIFFQPGVDIRT